MTDDQRATDDVAEALKGLVERCELEFGPGWHADELYEAKGAIAAYKRARSTPDRATVAMIVEFTRRIAGVEHTARSIANAIEREFVLDGQGVQDDEGRAR